MALSSLNTPTVVMNLHPLPAPVGAPIIIQA